MPKKKAATRKPKPAKKKVAKKGPKVDLPEVPEIQPEPKPDPEPQPEAALTPEQVATLDKIEGALEWACGALNRPDLLQPYRDMVAEVRGGPRK